MHSVTLKSGEIVMIESAEEALEALRQIGEEDLAEAVQHYLVSEIRELRADRVKHHRDMELEEEYRHFLGREVREAVSQIARLSFSQKTAKEIKSITERLLDSEYMS